jgi:DNA repair protein RadC
MDSPKIREAPCSPSAAARGVVTRKLSAALDCVGLTLLDHVILGYDGIYSFVSNDLMARS